MAAAKYRLGNLTAILDYNGIQQTGATVDVMPTEPIGAKWEAFGWHVQDVHGHNVGEMLNALDFADEVHARPSVIIARTTKGKVVSDACPVPLKRVGVADRFAETGPYHALLERYGMGVSHIVAAALAAVATK